MSASAGIARRSARTTRVWSPSANRNATAPAAASSQTRRPLTATTATTATNIGGGSANQIPYQTASSTTGFLGTGSSGQVLESQGASSAPTWVNQSSLTSGNATNIASGTAGALPYQTGSSATTFLNLGTSGYVLTAGASAPQYTAQSSLAVGTATNLAGGGAGYVPYQSASGTTSFVSAGTSGQVLTSNGSSAPTWTTPTAYATVTDDTTTNATRYPLFANVTTGNLTTEYTSSTKYQYNPSTGVLTATGFSGSGAALTSLTSGNLTGTIPSTVLGNSTLYVGTTAIALNRASASQTLTGTSIDGSAGSATTATTATNANNVAVTDNTSTNATYYPTFVSNTTGNLGINTASTKLKFNPSTGAMTASQLIIAP